MFDAVRYIAGMCEHRPVYLAGFSLGANFALRVAQRASFSPIDNLKQVAAVNPPLDPLQGTINVDRTTMIKGYFLHKWKRSLRKKQACFPDLYDFTDALCMDNCMEMTDLLIKRHTDYKDCADYFGRYTLKKDFFNMITVPTLIITSQDDPIIPVHDFYHIPENKAIDLFIHPFGGHCGYIMGLDLSSWYHYKILGYLSVDHDLELRW